jgi:hypothetical protein
MKPITADADAVAYCGLYCGACRKYRSDKCPGCAGNDKASWCKVRTCCMEHGYTSCADCTEFTDFRECKKLNNFVASMFAVFFRSNRMASLDLLKEKGPEGYAEHMAEKGLQSLPR